MTNRDRCNHDHLMQGDNLKIDKRGWRYCRQCNADRVRSYRREAARALRLMREFQEQAA